MTDKANVNPSDLTSFLREWMALWQDELQAQAADPIAMDGTMEMWRAMVTAWADLALTPAAAAGGDRARRRWPTTPRPTATSFAPDARDAAIERLAHRVDELEHRLADLAAQRPNAKLRRRGLGGVSGDNRG